MTVDIARKVNNDRLGLGERELVVVTVTTTRTNLNDLLNTASAGRVVPGNLRFIRLHNLGSAEIYTPVSSTSPASLTTSTCTYIAATSALEMECSNTLFADTIVGLPNQGFLFATASGTQPMAVEMFS